MPVTKNVERAFLSRILGALVLLIAQPSAAQFLQVQTGVGTQAFSARQLTTSPFWTWEGTYTLNEGVLTLSSFTDPQIAVGPNDVLTTAGRILNIYPNPNSPGKPPVTNPLNYPTTFHATVDQLVSPQIASLCPSGTGFIICVIDNVTVRYDQMQGRFVIA